MKNIPPFLASTPGDCWIGSPSCRVKNRRKLRVVGIKVIVVFDQNSRCCVRGGGGCPLAGDVYLAGVYVYWGLEILYFFCIIFIYEMFFVLEIYWEEDVKLQDE